jgi:hypothetical protein
MISMHVPTFSPFVPHLTLLQNFVLSERPHLDLPTCVGVPPDELARRAEAHRHPSSQERILNRELNDAEMALGREPTERKNSCGSGTFKND